MKKLLPILIICFLSACSANNQCAKNGENWGYVYGIFKTKNPVKIKMYSLAGRHIGSKYCQ